jgi:hypothetical protein
VIGLKIRKNNKGVFLFMLILVFSFISIDYKVYAALGLEYVLREEIPIAPGVIYTSAKLKGKAGVEVINFLEVDIENPYISLQPTKGREFTIGLETVREQARALQRSGQTPVASFNMDFYNTDPNYGGLPSGTLIINREIISAISYALILGIFPSGEVAIGTPKMECQISVGRTSIQINSVNKLRGSGQAVIYTPRYSSTMTTKTNDNGVEVIIYTGDNGLYLNKEVVGIVKEIRDGKGNSTIPVDGLVVSASGGPASWLLKNLKVGSECTINLQLESKWNNLCQAVGGGPMLVERGRISSLLGTRSDSNARHPRTAIGIKGNKVYFITVDGRQPNYSDGVTLSELAQILVDEGIEKAMNVDGGGSTTFAVRYPGDEFLSIANSPSDFRERSVSSAMHVISTAPGGELTYITLSPKTIQVFTGSEMSFDVKGQDQYYNKVPLDKSLIEWDVKPSIGSISSKGVMTAGDNPGEGWVYARIGEVTGKAGIKVIDDLTDLKIRPASITINPRDKEAFYIEGITSNGEYVYIGSNLVQWSVKGDIGIVSHKGEFSSSDKKGEGYVIASLGDLEAESRILIGKPPVIIDDFEGEYLNWTNKTARARGGVDLASRPRPVWRGTHSAELYYDFTITPSGTTASYMVSSSKSRIILEERPIAIGLWLYGDGAGHWFRGDYRDGNGTMRKLDFTGSGGLNWQGWRYVEASIPPDVPLPIEIIQIYVVETDNTRKNMGYLYIDDIVAIFSRATISSLD